MSRFAFDTNLLIYAEGHGDRERVVRAQGVVEKIPVIQVIIPAQVLGELYRVLVGKARYTPREAQQSVLSWFDSYTTSSSSAADLMSAMDISADHGLQIWDSLIMAVAARENCRLLITEDLHDGFTWRGVTVADPFAATPHPLLTPYL